MLQTCQLARRAVSCGDIIQDGTKAKMKTLFFLSLSPSLSLSLFPLGYKQKGDVLKS
jgi:hypothetical protein